MKKLIVVLLNMCLFFSINAQTYRALFDQMDQKFQNGGLSFNSNFKSELQDQESIVMRAYITM